jgi:signal transduction histidine kinase
MPPVRGWTVWLPAAAVAVALVLVALAWVAAGSVAARHGLALDGRVLGLAHSAERELRDVGVAHAADVLADLVTTTSGEVLGLRLDDVADQPVASAGRCDEHLPSRTVELFLGRGAADGPRAQAGRRHGRGRFTLHLFLEPTAGRPPLAARLLLPAALVIGVCAVALALWSSRLLERQRRLEAAMADRRRLEGLARAGAGLAHQLRTPLATIKGSCQLVQEQAPGGPWDRRLTTAVSEASRMERTLSLLLDFARPPQPEPVEVDLHRLLHRMADQRSRVAVDGEVAAIANVDQDHLEQLLSNLVENALQASADDAPVGLSARGDDGRVVIEVADRGSGPGEDPEQLFEPYVTGRADGTGLGLPIARMLAEVNRGSVTLHHRAEGGCVARVVLPAARERS